MQAEPRLSVDDFFSQQLSSEILALLSDHNVRSTTRNTHAPTGALQALLPLLLQGAIRRGGVLIIP